MNQGMKRILLVEDDRIDVMTTLRALKEVNVVHDVHVAANGEEALEFLKKNDSPCLILLDLNMPRMNGIEFLRVVKAIDLYKAIPVVVLTTSKDDKDVAESFSLGVAGYMIKPVSYIRFVETMRMVNLYWSLSEIPAGVC